MSVLLPTLLKTTGDSSCLLRVLRAFSVYRYCVAAASCLLSPSPKRRERPSLCPPLLPSRLRHHLIAQNPMPSDVDVYTPIPRKCSKTSHVDTMSPPLSALPKSPRKGSHVPLSLLPSRRAYKSRLARLLFFHIHRCCDNSRKL
jgi:hypothetical protein